MVRKPRVDENGIKKGAWSQEEDDKLRAFVQRYGHRNWRQLPKFAGLSRCGKSCRLRWLNYLKQDVKRGNYTEEEEDLILNLHEELGNKWSIIAEKLPGRTDNEIKNHWHSHLKKRANQSSTLFSESSSSALSAFNLDSLDSYAQQNHTEQSIETCNLEATKEIDSTQGNFDHSLSNDINWFTENNLTSFDNIGNFWTEPFLVDAEAYGQGDFLLSSPAPFISYYNNNIEFSDNLLFREL